MHDKYHGEDNDPTNKGTYPALVPFLVEDNIADEDRTKDLSHPVHQIVQATRMDGEDGCVIVIKFCVITRVRP
jgi:hypothetical protein